MIEQYPDSDFGDEPGTWSSYEIHSPETPSEAIVYAVAAATDRDPLDCRPLYDVVDPDAVDKLFDRDDNADRSAGTRLRFVYEGHEITIDEGCVVLRELDRGSLRGQQ